MARYPFPWDLFAGLSLALPSRRRSFLADCREAVSRIDPPPVVEGADAIPLEGALVVVANHYQRRGLWIGWPGAVITVAIAERRGLPTVNWLVTGGLRLQQWKRSGPEIPLMRSVLKAVADTYGMTALPLAGPRERALAIRAWVRRGEQGQVLGIFPEGLMGSSAGLREPEAGFAALIRMVGEQKVSFLPCGIFERADVLHIRFGQSLSYDSAMRADPGNRIMEAIAFLLPLDQRGAYAGLEAPAFSSQPTDERAAGG